MTDKNFINFHILISHSPSCLNRDDMNMQKTAIFGGHRRVRISSQSLKRAMRKSPYYRQHLGLPSTRTRELGRLQQRFVAELQDRYPEKTVITALEWIAGKQGLSEATVKNVAVAPWAVDEVAWFCEQIQQAGDEADAKKLAKQIEKNAAPLRAALASAIDIALSGRMATSGLMTNMDGALAVAHAITTHPVDSDIDWFTAVDDLVEADMRERLVGETEEGKGEQGSGHLNTQEFSSGVFYRYASLNISQLQQNLGGAPRTQALEIAAHVLHMLATVVPTAKNQSTAPFNLADYAMVGFSDQPVSLANAFERPVGEQGGYLAPSIDALKGYWQRIHRGYGLDERVAAFQIEGGEGEPASFTTLAELQQWLVNDGRTGGNDT
jgi:CRISPR system Cascade subunit CasC